MPVEPVPCAPVGGGGDPIEVTTCCSPSIASTPLCRADGSAVLLVVRSGCADCGATAEDPAVAGWIDPASGAFTAGPAPADVTPCETGCVTVAMVQLCDLLPGGDCQPFLRHLVRDCAGTVTAAVDTALDGITGYAVVGTAGDCSACDVGCVDTICRQLCDDTDGDGQADATYSELWCVRGDGSAEIVLIYQDDPSTPYVPVAPVACTYGCPESETVTLCDVAPDGTSTPFLRRYRFLNGTASYEDVALDGQTPHVVIGTVGVCAASEPCEAQTTPAATLGLCLADGTPIAVVVTRDCDGTTTQDGWLNLTTGAWSAGDPPAGTMACGNPRSISTTGTFCDVDPTSGDVYGLVLIEYTYGADGAVTAVRLVDATTGSTYTPQGEVTTCPAGVEQPERDLIQLCDVAADGTVTEIVRDYARDENGAITGHTDYLLDGTPYTPTGTVGRCTEQCRDCETVVLCDADANPPATIAGTAASGTLSNGVTWAATGPNPFAPSRQSDGADWWATALFPNPVVPTTVWTFSQPVNVEFSVVLNWSSATGATENQVQIPAGAVPVSLPAGYTYDRTTRILHADNTLTGCTVSNPTRAASARFRVTGVTSFSLRYLGTRAVNVPCQMFGHWAFGALDVSLGAEFLRTVCRDCTGAVTSTTDTLLDGTTPYAPVGTVGFCQPEPAAEEPCRDSSSTLLCDTAAQEVITVLDPAARPGSDGWEIVSYTGFGPGYGPEAAIPYPVPHPAGNPAYMGVRSDLTIGPGPAYTGYETAPVRWVMRKTFSAPEDGIAVVTSAGFRGDGGARVRVNGVDAGMYGQWNQPATSGTAQIPVTAGPNTVEIEVRDGGGQNWIQGRLDIVMTRTVQFMRRTVVDCETGETISVTDTTLDGDPYEVTGVVGQCEPVAECCEQPSPETRVDVESDVLCIQDADGEVLRQVLVERVYDDQTGDRVVQRLTDPTTGDEVELPPGAELVLCQEPLCPTAFSTECVGAVTRTEASYDNTSLIGGMPGQCGSVQGPDGQFPCLPASGAYTITSWIVNGEEVIAEDGGRAFNGGACGPGTADAPGMHLNWSQALTNLDPTGAVWTVQNEPACAWFVGSTGGTQTVYGPMTVVDEAGQQWVLGPAQACEETQYTKVYSQECDGSITVSWLDAQGVETSAPVGELVPCGTGCGAGGGAGLDVETLTLCDIHADGTTVPFLRHLTYGSAGQVAVVVDTGLDGFAPYTPTGTVTLCQPDAAEPGTDVETWPLCVLNIDGTVLQHVRAEQVYDGEGQAVGFPRIVDAVTGGPVAIPGGATIGVCPGPEPEPCRNSSTLLVCDLPGDGEPTAAVTDTAPTPYDASTAGADPVTGGAATLWAGGTLTIPPDTTQASDGSSQRLRSFAATVQAVRPGCDIGLATLTASIQVERTGPDPGCAGTGIFALVVSGIVVASQGVTPTSIPVGTVRVLTVTAQVPAADLDAGTVTLVGRLETYHRSPATCTGGSNPDGARIGGWNVDEFTISTVYDQTGCAEQVFANVVTDCETGETLSVSYTLPDGTPYTPTGTIGQCEAGGGACCPERPCGDTEVVQLCDLTYDPQAPIPTPAGDFALTGNVVAANGGTTLWFAQANQAANGVAELTVGGLLPAVMYEFRFASAWIGAGSPTPATNNAIYLLEILDGATVLANRTRNVSAGSNVFPGGVLTEDLPPVAFIAPATGAVTIRFTDQTTGGPVNDRDLFLMPLEVRTAVLTVTSTPFLRRLTYDCFGDLTSTQDVGLDGVTPYVVQGEVSSCASSGDGSAVAAPNGPDVEIVQVCDVAPDGSSVPFLRQLTYEQGVDAPTVVDTALDGVTPYTPTGTVGLCQGGNEDCPRHVLTECRWDDTDADGLGDVEYVELIAVDGCTGALTTLGTYTDDLTAPYTPIAPTTECPVEGAPPAVAVQARRTELTAGGSWEAATVPLLQSVTATAHGGTGQITTADGASTLHLGESVTWSVARAEDSMLVGPLTITAQTGTVTISYTQGVTL